MDCKDFEEKLDLYLYQELPPSDQQRVEEHASRCEACLDRLEQMRRLHTLLTSRPATEITPELLVRSRLKLEDALDAEQLGWRRLLADWFPLRPGAHAPRAAVVLVLLVLGFGLGWALRPGATKAPSVDSLPVKSSFLGSGLGQISSISQVLPDPATDQVRITLNAQHHVTLEGSLDDPRIRQILVDAVKSYDNAGIRLDTLNALGQKRDDPSIQNALLYALQRDPNPGVRLQAVESARQMTWSDRVQTALVQAAAGDNNPGVRVAAIDALVSHALSQRDESLIPVLQGFAERDANNYVRIKALAAVHELEE
ncbi:MAG TPA: HEAT repeat domain-containing protein, partial [Terriglobia bacterium]|nr:HEAT repeat domain-containing protein [Terriglobia bacterium]